MSTLIDTDFVRARLQEDEGQYLEFKGAYEWDATGKKRRRKAADLAYDIAKALCAFANSDGGTPLVGVEKDKTVTGSITHPTACSTTVETTAFLNRFRDYPLNERQRRRLVHAFRYGSFSLSDYRKVNDNLALEAARQEIAELKRLKVVWRRGRKKGTRYFPVAPDATSDEKPRVFLREKGSISRREYAKLMGLSGVQARSRGCKVIIFVDELNKHAPTRERESPIIEQVLDIAERGRSLGVVLLGAEQFMSAVHERVVGNCATTVIGRSGSAELSSTAYDPAVKANIARLEKGELVISHATFHQPVKILFPRPAYKQEGME
ncbi:MAG: RNA-binding domain-containing protein [bacterium]